MQVAARIFLRMVALGLGLVLAGAVATEVVALHRFGPPTPPPGAPPVVVRKAPRALTPLKTVRPVPVPQRFPLRAAKPQQPCGPRNEELSSKR